MKTVKISIAFLKFVKLRLNDGKPCKDMEQAIAFVRKYNLPYTRLKQKNSYGSVSSWDSF